MNYYIGMMSGTSLDGIDAVLVSDNDGLLKLESTISQAFPDDLKRDLQDLLMHFTIHLRKLGRLETYLSYCYADCASALLSKANVPAQSVKAIGCHGQTVFHEPRGDYPFTMQLVDGNVIAARTCIATVVDFRRMDVAVGGGGAPLTPAFHQKYFYSPLENRVILNLGGIANITILNRDSKHVFGFDNGPANCLMDLWIQKSRQEKYDRKGQWAASGNVNGALLAAFLKEPYFSLEAPKSTGKELFNLRWIENKLLGFENIAEVDVQATLCELTAISIANDIKKYAPNTGGLYICGGGYFNDYLRSRLQHYLPKVAIASTSALGIDPKWVEAIAFAWLAKMRCSGKVANLPSVTGAKKEVLLGAIYE